MEAKTNSIIRLDNVELEKRTAERKTESINEVMCVCFCITSNVNIIVGPDFLKLK